MSRPESPIYENQAAIDQQLNDMEAKQALHKIAANLWVQSLVDKANSVNVATSDVVVAFDNDGTIFPHTWGKANEEVNGFRQHSNIEFFKEAVSSLKIAGIQPAIVSRQWLDVGVEYDENSKVVKNVTDRDATLKSIYSQYQEDQNSPLFQLPMIGREASSKFGKGGALNLLGLSQRHVVVVDDDAREKEKYQNAGFKILASMEGGVQQEGENGQKITKLEQNSVMDLWRQSDEDKLKRVKDGEHKFGFCPESVLMSLLKDGRAIPQEDLSKVLEYYRVANIEELGKKLAQSLGVNEPTKENYAAIAATTTIGGEQSIYVNLADVNKEKEKEKESSPLYVNQEVVNSFLQQPKPVEEARVAPDVTTQPVFGNLSGDPLIEVSYEEYHAVPKYDARPKSVQNIDPQPVKTLVAAVEEANKALGRKQGFFGRIFRPNAPQRKLEKDMEKAMDDFAVVVQTPRLLSQANLNTIIAGSKDQKFSFGALKLILNNENVSVADNLQVGNVPLQEFLKQSLGAANAKTAKAAIEECVEKLSEKMSIKNLGRDSDSAIVTPSMSMKRESGFGGSVESLSSLESNDSAISMTSTGSNSNLSTQNPEVVKKAAEAPQTNVRNHVAIKLAKDLQQSMSV